jgi:hypothetical protein
MSARYTQIKVKDCEPAAICDVIVYGGAISDHSGLVVELDANKKPKMVVSKWGKAGGVFAHPPRNFGATPTDDWEIHRRPVDALGVAQSAEVERLKKAYDDEAAKAAPDVKALHAKAIALCQEKNKLKKWY